MRTYRHDHDTSSGDRLADAIAPALHDAAWVEIDEDLDLMLVWNGSGMWNLYRATSLEPLECYTRQWSREEYGPPGETSWGDVLVYARRVTAEIWRDIRAELDDDAIDDESEDDT